MSVPGAGVVPIPPVVPVGIAAPIPQVAVAPQVVVRSRPSDPLMGTTEETYAGSNVFYYAFGGVPKPDWSGLDASSERLLADTCFRSLDPVSGQKSGKYRTSGLELDEKYKKGMKLSEFQKVVWDHLVKYGLDTIGYLPDPRDPTKVHSVVTHHARFTGDLAKSILACSNLKSKFDQWDKKNDYEAREFLLNSLSKEIKEGFQNFHDKADSFGATWLKLVHYLVTTTAKTFDKMKDLIRTKRPQQYAGQDIEKMGSDFITLARELDNAGYYDHGLTLNMVDAFLCASKDDKGTFHHSLNNMRYEVSRLEQETVFLSKLEQDAKFATSKLSFKDVCLRATKEYKDLHHQNLWEPSKLPKDRHAPPSSLANLAQAEILTLIEQVKKSFHPGSSSTKKKYIKGSSAGSGSTKGKGCFNCDSPDHQVKDCPKPKPTDKQSRVKRHSNMSKWKLTPPKGGEPHKKEVNGRTFEWCNHCGNWTTTHNTDSHTGVSKSSGSKSTSFKAESNLAAWEPAAWLTEVQVDQPSLSWVNLLQYFYFVISLMLMFLRCSTQSPTSIFNFICQTIFNTPSWLQTLWQQHQTFLLSSVAPVLWILCGLALLLGLPKVGNMNEAVFDELPRAERRLQRKYHPPRLRLQSAYDHGLRPSYPMRLRNNNDFKGKLHAPKLHQQHFNSLIHRHLQSIDPVSVHHPQTTRPPRPPTPSKRARRRLNFDVNSQVKKSKSRGPSSGWMHPDPKWSKRHKHDSWQHPESKHLFNKSKRGTTQPSSQASFCRPCAHSNTFCTSGNCSVPSYKPCGVPTNRHLPNLKPTVKQHKSFINLMTAKFSSSEAKSLAYKIALLAPRQFQKSMAHEDKFSSFPIIWDSGASVCITPTQSDFLEYNTDVDFVEVKGLGGKSSSVAGTGTVLWSMHDTKGNLRHLKLPAYHVPRSNARLISTSVLLEEYPGEHLTVLADSLELSGVDGDPTRASVLVFNNPSNRLPTTTAYNYSMTSKPVTALCNTVSTVHEANHNLSEAHKELLRWHQRLGHLAFKKIQHLMRTGVLSNTAAMRSLHTSASKLKSIPKCAACLFGKQTVRKSPGSTTTAVKDRAGVLKAGNLLPGSEVSVDHFVSSVKGRLLSGYDKGSDDSRHIGGCIFVDHASSYIHVELQSSLSSHETLRAKMSFEEHCRDSGVMVHTYMSDNGKAFVSKDFTEHLSSFQQVSKLAGVGAHHHNAQAERAIRTIMSIARTMMIHSGIHWPEMAQASLWSLAVLHACYVFNHVPDHSTGLSPADIFTKTRWPHKRFHDLHVWGCPVYVLEKSLQDGKKIPKWKPRSNRSVYMGVSNNHASSVPLVLNYETGAITPQFHVVFDDWFATVVGTSSEMPNFASDEWSKMFGNSTYQYVLDEEGEDELPGTDLQETLDHARRSDDISHAFDRAYHPQPLLVNEPSSTLPPTQATSHLDYNPTSTAPSEQATWEIVQPEEAQPSEEATKPPKTFTNPSPRLQVIKEESQDGPPRRSSRQGAHVKRLTYTHDKGSLTGKIAMPVVYTTEGVCVAALQSDTHYIFVSSKSSSNPDTFDYDTAMSGEHRDEWIEAASSEISSLENLDCWEEVPMDEATTKVLPGTWVFRVKRAPDGSFKKWKARYCIRGDLQEGEFETYAPVVQFPSVRLFLAWSLMFGWVTCCIDFSNAFIQATLTDPTFIHLPRGFSSALPGKTCLKLKKSIYGLSVAPRLWFQHLWKALKKTGLKQSEHDPCLLLRKDLIVIAYVDDLGIQAPSMKVIDELIKFLEDSGFELTREGSFTDYLGINYAKTAGGTITMTQEGLIDKIIEATGMQGCNPNRTPTTKEALGSDPEGPPMEEIWSYRSVVGMLLYLSTNTRPDIAYAVSQQVARFSHFPKKSHASAVKMLVRYLAGTKNKGVIYKRPSELTLDCYVDSDFAGLYGQEPEHEPVSVKSRTGYIISFGGCYILCKSQLQSTISLSTSEAEYGALSQCMRAVLPLRETIIEMISIVDVKDVNRSYPFGSRSDLLNMPTRIYEDNAAALSLANNQKVTSRTKHWSVKFHFFWEHINDPKKNLSCLKVDTKNQRADYLTKGLTRDLFEHCRHHNQGW